MAGDDDLDALRDALDRATPRPDPVVRAAHLRTAGESFGRLHGAAAPARDRPGRWDWLWGRGALAAVAVAACGVLVLTPVGRGVWQGPLARDEAASGAAPATQLAEAEVAAKAAPEEATARVAPEALPAPPPAPMAETTMMAAPEVAGAEAAVAADSAPSSAARSLSVEAAEAGSLAEVRAALLGGTLPRPEAVRVGELVGALAGPLSQPVGVLPTPWDPATRLVVIAAEGGVGQANFAPGVEAQPIAEGGPVVILAVSGGDGDLGTLLGVGADGPIPITGREEAGEAARFAVAVAGWALLLRGEIGGWSFGDAAALAEANLGGDPDGRRAEVVDLMRRSAALAR